MIIALTWTDTSPSGAGLATDVLYGCLYNATLNQIVAIPPTATREDETLAVVVPDPWDDGSSIYIYGAFRRADGLDASDTMFNSLTT